MRQLAALLSMLIALSAGATELWRWKDADGVVHYSDRPVQGAERIDVKSTQKSTGEFTPVPPRPATPTEAPPPTTYTRCVVLSPTNDQVFNNVNSVDVTLAVDPGLGRDHQLQVLLNGRVDPDWPSGAFSNTLSNLYRGSYTLALRVLDENGRERCASPIVNFHVRQASILSPARRPPAKKP